MVTLAAILNIAIFGRYECALRLHFAFYHINLFSLYFVNYLNKICNSYINANDFQYGTKYKMAATFHILSFT